MTTDNQLVAQRLRNRVLEYLELVATAELDVPALKTSDIVNLWEDSVSDMPNPLFEIPPYTRDEAEALEAFAKAWQRFCVATPQWPETYTALFAHAAWRQFREAAAVALTALMKRGLLPED